ncbi:hypothetical protein [Arabiibacter massiliensis]|uniref:hypothetical protein n=1 Tax=Arabiibacter massiliensis TaxID=1870985 RepID=UPI00117A1AEB|nr:hypothetical protein [Arabiibacter massiliensis]
MNAAHRGLYDAAGMAGQEAGTREAIRDAATLAAQAASVALVRALALDATANGESGAECGAGEVMAATSRLAFKCHDDITAAMGLLG